MKTTTTTEVINLTNAQITEACKIYAKALGLPAELASATVEISPDSSWAAEGKNEHTAQVTFTTVVKSNPEPPDASKENSAYGAWLRNSRGK